MVLKKKYENIGKIVQEWNTLAKNVAKYFAYLTTWENSASFFKEKKTPIYTITTITTPVRNK